VTRKSDVRAGAGWDQLKFVARTITPPLLHRSVSRNTLDADTPELVSVDRRLPDQPVRIIRTVRNGRGTRPVGPCVGAGAFQSSGSACESGEPPRVREQRRPRPWSGIASRRLHAAHEHSSQHTARCLSKTPPYAPLNDFIPDRFADQPTLPTCCRPAAGVTSPVDEPLRRRKRSRVSSGLPLLAQALPRHLAAVNSTSRRVLRPWKSYPERVMRSPTVLARTIEGRTTYMFAPISIPPDVQSGGRPPVRESCEHRSSLNATNRREPGLHRIPTSVFG